MFNNSFNSVYKDSVLKIYEPSTIELLTIYTNYLTKLWKEPRRNKKILFKSF